MTSVDPEPYGAALAAAKMAEKFGVYEFAEKIELDFAGLTPEERELLSRAGHIINWTAPIEWSGWDVSLGLVLAPARARLA